MGSRQTVIGVQETNPEGGRTLGQFLGRLDLSAHGLAAEFSRHVRLLPRPAPEGGARSSGACATLAGSEKNQRASHPLTSFRLALFRDVADFFLVPVELPAPSP